MADLLGEFSWRGLLHQCTNETGLRSHLAAGPRKMYVGFDPTADSLTIGNLVGIMNLARAQRAGHVPYALMGGGTGLIGDPSGKSAERTLQTREQVAANVERIRKIFDNLLDFSAGARNPAVMVNNIDWLEKLSYLEALRDIGKHFSVNMMIQKDSVKSRLEGRDHGISYTEFSYMLLQSYDFAYLHRAHGVTLEGGGSDQWGNIVGGVDLVRRWTTTPGSDDGGAEVFGITWPLVTKADGGKFGKTESGAVWLTAERTSPYAYYQFWLNAADADVVKFLRIYTHLTRDEIAALEAAHVQDPGQREAHRALARAATGILHGPTETAQAEAAAKALFSGDIANLPKQVFNEAFASAPSSNHDKVHLAGAGIGLIDLLVQVQLATSKSQAREFLSSGSVSVNGRKVGIEDRVTIGDLLHGSVIALRRGKKGWHLTRWA